MVCQECQCSRRTRRCQCHTQCRICGTDLAAPAVFCHCGLTRLSDRCSCIELESSWLYRALSDCSNEAMIHDLVVLHGAQGCQSSSQATPKVSSMPSKTPHQSMSRIPSTPPAHPNAQAKLEPDLLQSVIAPSQHHLPRLVACQDASNYAQNEGNPTPNERHSGVLPDKRVCHDEGADVDLPFGPKGHH